jgi:hypothetical protein
MSRRGIHSGLVAVCFGALVFTAGAGAGQSVELGVARVDVARSGAIVLFMTGAAESSDRLTLAQVTTRRIYAAGKGCGTRATSYDIAQLADHMKLGGSAQLVHERNAARTAVYISPPSGGQFRITASLNYRIVSAGLARVSGPREGYYQQLFAVQTIARKARRGIWTHCSGNGHT